MRLNEDICIAGQKVVLVPYRREHVPQYHQWMQDPELLELTCSERLSLEDEYENQAAWQADPRKCTFIVLDRTSSSPAPPMAGDVNLFVLAADEESADERADNDIDLKHTARAVEVEIEVMIAERGSRRKGLAQEALSLMMAFFLERGGVRVSAFVAKILQSNKASIKLFSSLGFTEFRRIEAFEEVHMQFDVKSHADQTEKLRRHFESCQVCSVDQYYRSLAISAE